MILLHKEVDQWVLSVVDLVLADAGDDALDAVEEPMRFVLDLPPGGVSLGGGGVSPPLLHGPLSAWTPADCTALVDPNAPSAMCLAELFGSRELVQLKRLGVTWRDNGDHAWVALQVWEVPAQPYQDNRDHCFLLLLLLRFLELLLLRLPPLPPTVAVDY